MFGVDSCKKMKKECLRKIRTKENKNQEFEKCVNDVITKRRSIKPSSVLKKSNKKQ